MNRTDIKSKPDLYICKYVVTLHLKHLEQISFCSKCFYHSVSINDIKRKTMNIDQNLTLT